MYPYPRELGCCEPVFWCTLTPGMNDVVNQYLEFMMYPYPRELGCCEPVFVMWCLWTSTLGLRCTLTLGRKDVNHTWSLWCTLRLFRQAAWLRLWLVEQPSMFWLVGLQLPFRPVGASSACVARMENWSGQEREGVRTGGGGGKGGGRGGGGAVGGLAE